MLIGDNESRYFETFTIYSKHGRLCVCFHTTDYATVTYHFEQLSQLIVRSL